MLGCGSEPRRGGEYFCGSAIPTAGQAFGSGASGTTVSCSDKPSVAREGFEGGEYSFLDLSCLVSSSCRVESEACSRLVARGSPEHSVSSLHDQGPCVWYVLQHEAFEPLSE